MDALLTSFLAALLAEFGDKTQLLVMALAVRYGRPAPILGGILLAALLNGLVAGLGGRFVHDLVVPQAASLLVALALAFAGVSGFIPQRQPDMGRSWTVGPLVTAGACFFLLEFGDKTQFVTAALAAYHGSLALVVAGATAGVMATSVPAALLGDRLRTLAPLRPIRLAIASLFLLAGFITAINALRLV